MKKTMIILVVGAMLAVGCTKKNNSAVTPSNLNTITIDTGTAATAFTETGTLTATKTHAMVSCVITKAPGNSSIKINTGISLDTSVLLPVYFDSITISGPASGVGTFYSTIITLTDSYGNPIGQTFPGTVVETYSGPTEVVGYSVDTALVTITTASGTTIAGT